MNQEYWDNVTNWANRLTVALMLWVGILMGHGGFWAGLAVAVVSVPLAVLNFTWPALSSTATVVFLGGLFMWISGVHLGQ